MTFRPRLRPRQHGNTLVGIIIGLVIGLTIAVLVALAITKGSTPFTDRAGKGGKVAEPTAGQAADPNKPMYGNKDAAREAAKDFTKESEPKPKPPEADPLQQVIAGFKNDPVKPEPKAEARAPVSEKSRPAPPATAPAAAAPAKADAGDDKWVYYLQAGAFREVSDAENTRAKLALMGFEATVSDRSTDNGVLHRVRMGPYNQVEAMNRARSKLSDNGIDVAVVRNPK